MPSNRYQLKRSEKTKQRFSLRKISVGTASVLLGTWIAMGGSVSADELVQVQPISPDSSQQLPDDDAGATSSSDLAETPAGQDQDTASVQASSTLLEEASDSKSPLSPNDSVTDENGPSPVAKERLAGLTYKVTYRDVETGKVVSSRHFTVSVPTKEAIAETLVSVEAEAIAGYKLKDNELAVVEKRLKEKSSNLIEFKVVPTKASQDNTTGTKLFATETPVSNDQPYITIERYFGNNRYTGLKNHTLTKNGDIVDVVYKMGLTRITADEVELTPDAKRLGFVFDKETSKITGRLPLDANLALGTYEIGLQKIGDTSIKTTADLTIQSHKGFVPRIDLSRNEDKINIPDNYSGTYPYHESAVRLYDEGRATYPYGYSQTDDPLERHIESARIVNTSGTTDTNKNEFAENLGLPANDIVYKDMEVTATPFGHFVKDGPLTNATERTPQYEARFVLFGLDARETFNTPLKVVSLEQLDASEGVELELIDKTVLNPNPSLEYNPMDGKNLSGYPRWGREDTPYLVNFKKLPSTAGEYFVKFRVVDNLGLSKDFTIKFKTFERSQDGALTTADVRFDGNDDYLTNQNRRVTVPRSANEQFLAVVERNKDNAEIVPIDLPDYLEFDSATGQLKKKAGTLLTPGIYSVKFKAVDGHFQVTAPPRTFTYEVTDNIVAIPHQVWDEGTVISPINVTLEAGTPVKSIKLITTDDNASFYTEAPNTIKGYALKRTDANKTVRVEATYLREDGTEATVSTNFTYEIRANDEVRDIFLEVTNPIQTVREGDNFLDMVITTSEGGKLTVDRSKIPTGVTYDEATRTLSGKGYIRGTYNIPVLYERDNKVLTKIISLQVVPGQLIVDPIEKTVPVLTKLNDVLETLDPSWKVEFADGDAFGFLFSNGASIDTEAKKWTGTAGKVGTYKDRLKVTRTNENGTEDTLIVPVTLNVTPIEHTLEVTNKEQTITIGESIETIQITNSNNATLDEIRFPANSGLAFDATKKTITGQPLRAGVYTFDVVSKMNSDYTGNTNDYYYGIRESVTITVEPKQITVEAEDRTVEVGQEMPPIQFTTTEGAVISFDATRLPDGLTYDEATKTISGIPGRVGTYRLVVSSNFEPNVQDPVSKNFTITVTPKPISLEAEDRRVVVGQELDPIQFTTTEGAVISFDTKRLPDGLTYDEATKTISGTPTRVGTYRLVVKSNFEPNVQDPISKNFTITVDPIPATIEIENNHQTVQIGEALKTVVITTNKEAVLEGIYLNNILSEDTIIDFASGQWGLKYDPDTNSISGTPKAPGEYRLKLRSKNPAELGSAEVTEIFTFTVKPDEPIDLKVTNDRQLVVAGETIREISISNSDNTILELDESQLPEGVVYNPVTKTITGSPKRGGKNDIVVKALRERDGKFLTHVINLDAIDLNSALASAVQTPDPLVNPIPENTNLVTGKGIPNATVVVTFPDGTVSQPITVANDGTWSVTSPTLLVKGQSVTAKQTESGKTPSDAINVTVVPNESVNTPAGPGTPGRDGVDGKTPSIELEDGTDATGKSGVWVIVKDGDGREVNRKFIKNGETGTQGLPGTNGRDGRDGVDGKSPTITTTPGQDAEGNNGTTITITNPDGSTSKVFIKNGKDGRDGKDGVDGKSPSIVSEPGADENGNRGVWIITRDGNGNEIKRVFVQDGKSPSVDTVPGVDKDGNTGIWVIVSDVDGREVSRQFVRDGRDGKDGKDGKTPSVTTEPGRDEDGNTGVWIIVKDGDGNTVSRTFIKNCGCPKKTPTPTPTPQPKEMVEVPSNPPVVELPTAELDTVPSNPPFVELPIAEVPQPDKPSVPANPETPVSPIPETPEVPNQPVPSPDKGSEPKAPSVGVKENPTVQAKALPKTGDTAGLAIAALGLASVFSSLALKTVKGKREED